MQTGKRFSTAVLLALSLFNRTSAHSFLTKPAPYTRLYHTRHCTGVECVNACPIEYNTGMANTIANPGATWSRGETVNIEWAKNNHAGGFMRLALVPVEVMNNRTWHKRLTILHGCWHSGPKGCCGSDACGSDNRGTAFGRRVTIPTVFPNGDYVLGFAWYGGVRKHKGFFPDFFSCSHVRIAGGPLGGRHLPFFEAGDGPSEYVRDGQCYTSADFIGDCGNIGCVRKPAFWAVPRLFAFGSRPDSVTPEVVESAMEIEEEEDGIEEREGGLGHEKVPGGLCKGRFCCKKECGKCGGPGCGLRAGGADGCCMQKIERSGRFCKEGASPPCLLSRPRRK